MFFDRLPDGLVVDLGVAAHTLTRALDYVGVDDHSHGRRVGLISHRIARALGWDQEDRYFILIAGMLHDCGVSSTDLHEEIVDDLEHPELEEHCVRGNAFLNSFPPFRRYASVVRYHHWRWDNFYNGNMIGLKLQANLVYLADRLDVACVNYCKTGSPYDIVQNPDVILDHLRPLVGEYFAPGLFEGLEEAASKESFWFELKDDFLDEAIFETLATTDDKASLNFGEIEALGELISRIIDAKSPYTHFHSLRVADLVYKMGEFAGLSEPVSRSLRIAGLLHDVGKLRAPNHILEKPGKLDEGEFARIKRHTMDSKSVLNAMFPISNIARWASHHHEKLDGSGYPFGLKDYEIDRETRILTICDIFQALCQTRSYREALSLDKVLEIMTDMEIAGQIDAEIMGLLRENAQELYRIATFEGTSIEHNIASDLVSGRHAKPV